MTLTPEQFERLKMLEMQRRRLQTAPAPTPTPPTGGGYNPLSSVGEAFKSGLGQTVQGYQESRAATEQFNPLKIVEGGAKMVAGAINTAFSPLAPAFEPVRVGVEAIADKISDNPAFQKFANSKAGVNLERATEDVANLNTIFGVLVGARATPKVTGTVAETTQRGVSSFVEKAKPALQKVREVALTDKDTKALAIFTGEKSAIVESAIKNPKVADAGINGGDVALRTAVEQGAKSSLQARTSFETAYNVAFNQLAERYPSKLVSRQKVLYEFVDAVEKQGAKVKDGDIDFSTSVIKANPGEAAKINAAYDAIVNWTDFSLSGVNRLKQLVGKLTKFPTETGGTSKSPFLGQYYHFLDGEIKGQLPPNAAKVYGEMNKKYSTNIELYNEMVDAFNSGDPFSRLAQLFGENKDSLRQVVDFYEQTTGNKISPVVAGRALAERRQAAFGFLNPRSWIDFFIDPKIQAQLVTGYGKLKSGAQSPKK